MTFRPFSIAVAIAVLLPSSPVHASCHDRDEDGDGVNSCDDRCPGTPAGQRVDQHGCPCGLSDEDGDGVDDCNDPCVGEGGAQDLDKDSVPDCVDLCPGTEMGAQVDRHGCNTSFVHWESPHVHPLELSTDGTKLLAVNTAAHRLEVFGVSAGSLTLERSVPVGLEPVSVRFRTANEAWVVNHISDSVSIVDIPTLRVVATLPVGDEPCDVVFAGTLGRAFVSVSQMNRLEVFDPSDLSRPPILLPIEGEDPRSLATDGRTVFAAIFESGNGTTVLRREVVSAPQGPYGGVNPPPNRGARFEPPPRAGNPPPPPTALVVRRDPKGRWLDDNAGDWTGFVQVDLPDHDIARIDADTLRVEYASGLMNACMGVGIRPDGKVGVVGTDARNEVRFEPNIRGTFLSVRLALIGPGAPGAVSIVDLNPHLDSASPPASLAVRRDSIGDPRAIVWDSGDGRWYISGMGSNNVVVLDAEGRRLGLVETEEGPTGLALHPSSGRLYVLNRFAASVAVVDTRSLAVSQRVDFFDPTPPDVRAGRRHFYGTQRTSGLGHVACASCHIDARMDQLVWDLGNPPGEMKPLDQPCAGDTHPCSDWHPMKGPMATQTLVGILGSEPFHWRGDRRGLSDFNAAFETLLGAERELSVEDFGDLQAFLASISPPPNPNLNRDGTFKTLGANGGNPRAGSALFHSSEVKCVSCHASSDGSKPRIAAPELLQVPQGLKIPPLRNLYEKTGFFRVLRRSNRGFGFTHDGTIDTLSSLLLERGIDHSGRPAVMFPSTAAGGQRARDLEAFLQSFPTATHAAVGTQITISRLDDAAPDRLAVLGQMTLLAQSGVVGLVARSREDGRDRGFALTSSGILQSDRRRQRISTTHLLEDAGPEREVTFTVVPAGSQLRIGVDADADGIFDQDEIEGCSDPEDPASRLDTLRPCVQVDRFLRGDSNDDGSRDISDSIALLRHLFSGDGGIGCHKSADADDSGALDVTDAVYQLNFLFLAGAPLPEPSSVCGTDPTPDDLSCDRVQACRSLATLLANSVGMKLALVPAGSFLMGSPSSEADRELGGGLEGPVHEATISRPFYLGATEVTREQFQEVMQGPAGPSSECPDCPIAGVSWFDAEEFCMRLSQAEDRSYRLPTEAEWEYAARAGTTTRFHFGDAGDCFAGCSACPALDESAWWCGNGERRAQPVGRKRPNRWGLFDMHGNVFEWCLDWYGPYPVGKTVDPRGPVFGTGKILRGGDFGTALHACRSAARTASSCCAPDNRSSGTGFRVVLEAE